MRFVVPVAVATAAAFGLHTLPVRAFPGAAINLVRIDAEGIQPLPDITRAIDASVAATIAARQQRSQDNLSATAGTTAETTPEAPVRSTELSQLPAGGPSGSAPPGSASTAAMPEDIVFLLSGEDDLELTLAKPLPANASGPILIRVSDTASGGEGPIVERIPVTSPRVFLSDDRLFISIDPEAPISTGSIASVTLPTAPGGAPPQLISPNRFRVAEPAVAMERKAAPCPIIPPISSAATAASSTAAASSAAAAGAAAAAPAWLVPALLAGLAAIAVGAVAIAGSRGGGNAGTAAVSR
ncbi:MULTISPECIES: hypothetical protein [Aphanothece]|uniref:hypothetical protein n=1 Tax=Aphanothece TaxID=1121 RepID=UPI0039854018